MAIAVERRLRRDDVVEVTTWLSENRGAPQRIQADNDVSRLAAAYTFGIARNRPIVDGNKRTALVASELFLIPNGHTLEATDADCLLTFLTLAEGSLTEDEPTQWFSDSTRPG